MGRLDLLFADYSRDQIDIDADAACEIRFHRLSRESLFHFDLPCDSDNNIGGYIYEY